MVLEYVLLLAIGVIIGALVMRNLVGNSEEPRGLRLAWKCLIQSIGQDIPGKPGSAQRTGDCK